MEEGGQGEYLEFGECEGECECFVGEAACSSVGWGGSGWAFGGGMGGV